VRAGSLSDSRTVAILKKHFIPVVVTELCTKDLLPKEDVPLVEKYDEQLQAERRGSLYGGVREGMLLPDGTLYQFYSSLYTPDWSGGYLNGESMQPEDRPKTNQYVRAGREHKNGPVKMFFRAAARTLKKVNGKRPDDWQEILDGKTIEVAQVDRQTMVEPGDNTKKPVLRIWSRSSHSYYDSLVGAEIVELDDKDLQALADLVAPEGTKAWLDKTLCLRIAKAMVPRGGIWIALKDDSISCKIGATLDAVGGGHAALIEGRLDGEFVLEPHTAIEAGRRKTARPMFRSAGKLVGYFTYDVKKKAITKLRIVSKDVSYRRWPGFRPNKKPYTHEIGIELLCPEIQ
jgi:hypothetical protein